MKFVNESAKENSANALATANHETNKQKMLKLYYRAGKDGLTDDEIEASGFLPNSIRATRKTLIKQNLVVPVVDVLGEQLKRETRCKKQACVFGLIKYFQ